MPSMKVVAENDPFLEPVGPITDRPAISPFSFQRSQDPKNDLFALIVHGQNSDELRVQVYEAKDDVGKIFRAHGGISTGDINGSPGARLTKDWLITATHGENSERLFLISWDMKASGAEPRGDSGTQFGPPGGTADIAYVGGTKSVVALRDANDELRVIVFNASPSSSGAITRHDGDAIGKILGNPSIAAAGPTSTSNGLQTTASPGPAFVVTPFRSTNGRLKHICFEVDGNNIARRGDTGDNGTEITGRPAIAGWLKRNMVVTAAIRSGTPAPNALSLEAHVVDTNGGLVRVGTDQAIVGGESLTHTPSIAFGLGDAGGGEVATAVRTSSGRLRVDMWRITASGSLIHQAQGRYEAPDRLIDGSPSICPVVIGEDASIPRGYYVAARLQGSNRPTITKWLFDPN